MKFVDREGIFLVIYNVRKSKKFVDLMIKNHAVLDKKTKLYKMKYYKKCWEQFEKIGYFVPDYVKKEMTREYYLNDRLKKIRLPNNITKNLYPYQIEGVKMLEAGWTFLGDMQGLGKCICDSYILTNEGIKYINDITNKDGYENVNYKTIGLNNLEEVSESYSQEIDITKKITLDNGNEIEGTLVHPLYVLNEKGFEWKKLIDIKLGDIIVSKSNTNLFGDKYDNYDLGKLMGYLVANGSGKERLSFDTRKIKIAEDFAYRYKQVFNRDIKLNIKKSMSLHSEPSRIIYNEYYGHKWETARYKVIPECVLKGSKRTQLGFLQAMFDCDAYFNKYTLSLSSASRKVIFGVYTMLVNLGMLPWIKEVHTKSYDWTYYDLMIDRIDVLKLYENDESIKYNFDFKSECNPNKRTWKVPSEIFPKIISPTNYNLVRARKRGYLTKFIANLYLDNYNDKESLLFECCDKIKNDYFFNVVTKEDIKNEVKKVYDICVPKSHSFLANGIISHNTPQSCRFLELHEEYKTNIVICPGFLKEKWGNEIKTWTTKPYKILYGWKVEKLEPNFTYLINYDILAKKLPSFDNLDIDCIVVDEIHFCKNGDIGRTKAMNDLAKRCKRFIPVTGTPLLNNPIELYNSLNIVAPTQFYQKQIFEMNYCEFDYRYKIPKFIRAKNQDKLYNILKKSILIRRDYNEVKNQFAGTYDVKIESEIVPIELDSYEEYNFANENLFEYIKEKEGIKKAKRLGNSLNMHKPRFLKEIIYENKKEKIFQWVDEYLKHNQKICLFFMRTSHLNDFTKRYGRNALKINGETKTEDRFEMCNMFNQSRRLNVLCGNIKACGVGLDLIGSHTIAFVDFDNNFSNMEQVIKRADRFGQKSKIVNVYYFTGKNTIEDSYVMQKLDFKNNMAKNIIDGRSLKSEEKFQKGFT